MCCVVCEPSFTLLSCLCGLDFWKTAFGFQSLVLPSLPAPHCIIRDIIQWQPPPSFGCFYLAPFYTLAARSSCLNELRKDPMCTRPQCPPFWEVEGQERRDGDSRASMHQCSQSRRIETLATKASDPRLCPRLFLRRAGIRSQLNWVHLQKQQAGNCYTAVSNITSFLILVTRKHTPLPSKAK